MTEEQIKKLRRMILLFILGIALILLGISWKKGETLITDPADLTPGLVAKYTSTPVPSKGENTPTAKPTEQVDVTPGAEPTEAVEVTPGVEPTEAVEVTPTLEPTQAADATNTPTPAENITSTPVPTQEAGATPIVTPTSAATSTPSPVPTKAATSTPTVAPTKAATSTPTAAPTKAATSTPTPTPTKAPTNTPTPAASSGNSMYYGKLKVVGAQLTDSNGTPVQLRGMSTHGIGWFPEYVNKAAFTDLRNWGANLIRLAMYSGENGGYCTGGNKESLKKLITDGVQYATELDMYVIIDWHVLGDKDPTTYQTEAILFFDEMSKKYADNPHVIYEICNEPNGGTNWETVKKYAEKVIPVIKKNAPDAVIIVGTPNWCQDIDQAAASPITGYTNIMYAVHFYADTHRDWLRNKVTDAYNKGIPMFVSEFGICDASGNGACNEAEADKWIALLDKYGISYANWSLCNKNEAASFLSSSCSKKSGFTEADLSQSGKWMVRTLAKKNTNLPIAVATSAPTATPKPTATPSPSPTLAPGVTPTNTPTPAPTNTPTPTPVPTSTPTPVPTSTPTPTPTNTPTPSPTPNITYESVVVSAEEMEVTTGSGWTQENSTVLALTVKVVNNGTETEENWERVIQLQPGTKAEIFGSWCAVVTLENDKIILKPESYNGTIAPGGSVEGIGIQLKISW